MNKRNLNHKGRTMVAASNNKGHNSNLKNKVLSCSTPEHDSPSRDSDSICDSETTSPVPFLCTQDGADGETDVVWNYYTPKADAPTSRIKNSTPLSRKAKKNTKEMHIERPIQRRKPIKLAQKNSELFQDLLELNQNIHKFLEKKPEQSLCNKIDSDEDIFNNSLSPKSGLKTNNRCLRKNLLSSKFNKPDTEAALESDDSMNECLFRASQIVEEKIVNHTNRYNDTSKYFQDSVDNILSNIRIETPKSKVKRKVGSPCLNNDSFDNFVGNLNDSALERLTQLPVKNTTTVRESVVNKTAATSDWVLQDVIVHDNSPSPRKIFGRHSSMPESPSVDTAASKPSTSGMIFGRYNSMPYNKQPKATGDSPIRCTPDEIKKKHFQARERLLAKRLFPITTTQFTQNHSRMTQDEPVSKKPCFQPKVPVNKGNPNPTTSGELKLKQLIERKRQEALMKLRKKQHR